jgi:hypothetical protein
MRRVSIVAVVLALPLVLPAAAWAPDHRMRVTELKLADGGAAFVELQDSASEPFPSSYHLSIFAGDGTPMGTQPLDKTAFVFDTNPHAFDVDALPPGAGQVCFTRGMGGGDHIHCLAYGCPASPITSEGGSGNATAPAAGQSLQRQADGTYHSAAPTKGAANSAGSDAACGAAGEGGGGGAPDTLAPDQFLSFRSRQDVDRLAVSVMLNEAATVTARGSVNVPGAARRFALRTVRRDLAANVRKRFRLRLRRRGLRAVRNALEDGGTVRASVRIAAEDGAGNSSLKRPRIRLTD